MIAKRSRFRLAGCLGALVMVLLWSAAAGADSAATASPATEPAAAAPSATTPAAAAPSSTTPAATAASVGLLPVHGVTVDVDALAGKGGRGKDESTAALQSLWDSYLKAAGFNVIGFTVDVNDLGERGAVRVARLCEWAKRNNVRIAPNLIGAPEGKPLPADYPQRAAAFVGKVIAELGPAGAASYSQVMLYQLGRPLNHPASHGPMDAAAAGAVLKAAAEAVRAAEQAALAASGLQASPLLVSVSMDYELIRRGAIAHTALTDESYEGAADAASDWLTTVLGAAPVEAVAIEWYPGSLSSEGVDRMPELMTRLQGDLPGKLLLMDTGYSSAAGSDTAQARFYALALNNLCDLRARQGVESPFAGILWRNAVDGGAGSAKPLTPEQIAKQDWGERAKDLDRAWNDPKADAKEARSWVAGIQSNFGLLSRAGSSGSGLAPKTAFVVMSRLETALAGSPQAADALAAVQDLVASEKGGVGTQLKSRLQSAMFGLLDVFLSKTAESLFTPASEPAAPVAGLPPALPDVQIVGLGTLPATTTVGSPLSIPVTLFNAGTALAPDAAVYLRTAQADLAQSSPAALAPGASTTVQLLWTPSQPGKVSAIALQAYCSNDADPQTNRAELGDVQVNPGSTPPKPPRHWDVVSSGVFSSQATATFVTTTEPGSVRITGLQTTNLYTSSTPAGGTTSGGSWQVMSAPAPGGGSGGAGTTATPRSAPAPASGSAPAGGASAARPVTPASTPAPAPVPAPAASPITLTIANPFPAAFLDAVATLRVDGRAVATRALGTVLPRQQRTVSFTEWTAPKPGTYRIQVDLVGMGSHGKRMTTSATSQVVIGGAAAPVRALAGVPEPARGPAAPRSMMPLVRTASSQPVRGLTPRPLGRPGFSGVRPAFAGGVLGLSANGIVLRPFPPVADAPMDVSVQLANYDGTTAEGARVRVSVGEEDLGEVTVKVPAGGTAIASGFRAWPAKNGRHDVRVVVNAGTRSGEAAKAVFVTPAGARGFGRPGAGGMTAGTPSATGGDAAGGFRPRPVLSTGGQTMGGKPVAGGTPGFQSPRAMPAMAGSPDLAVTSRDIRITPASPSAGASAVVNVTVRNLGLGPATGGQVLLVLAADGKELARQQLAAAVPARGALPVQWAITAPPGVLTVTATTSCAADANPGNNVARAGATAAPVAPRTTGVLPGLTPAATKR